MQVVSASDWSSDVCSSDLASIKIRLKDAGGVQIGDTIDNTHKLEAGGVWRFTCPVTVRGMRTYELTELVGR
jgi:hypothetical protein